MPCNIVFAKPEDLETYPNHFSFHFLTTIRSSSYFPMAAWIFLRNPHWSYGPCVSLALLSRSITHRRTEYMDITRERISCTFASRDMLLSLHISLGFVRNAVACAILERASGYEPASESVAPRYLKLVTVRSFCPLTLISLWMPLALFVISFVFSAFIYISHLVQVLSRFVTRASCSCSSSAKASMSSVNRRLEMALPPMLTFPSCSSRASDIILSKKMLKRVGEREHPCLTPTEVLNHSPVLPFI